MLLADRREAAAIFAGGFAGALARALVGEWLVHDPGSWPWATFAVNVAGALLLGWLLTRLHDGRIRPSVLAGPLVGAGFCGALTTFSAIQVELLWMLDAGRTGLAAGYAAASVAAGLGAVTLATRLARGGRGPWGSVR